MAVGDGVQYGYGSFGGVARETAWGTKKTATTFMEFFNESLSKIQGSELITTINSSRNATHRILKEEVVQGQVSTFLNVASDAIVSALLQSMGGSCTSSGAAASGYTHSIVQGNMANTTQALTLQVRKGAVNPIFDYVGCRVNKLTIKAEMGKELSASFDFIGKYGTTSTDNLTVVLTEINPLKWDGITFKVGSFASMTSVLASGTAETITGFEFSYENGLVSGAEAHNLGSQQLGVLPVGMAKTSMKITQRYDTTTAMDRAFAETALSVGIVFNSSLTCGTGGGGTTYSMALTYPRAFVVPMQPKVAGPGVIMQEFVFEPLAPSATADVLTMAICNATANYA
jgi:hypothetical protein